MHRYEVSYKDTRLDVERLYLKIEQRIRRCPGGGGYDGCGLKVWRLRRRG